ncbi:Fic family protein [Pseudomonas sp. Gutcm_11s]|uniref:Fic family protein n=1 Tax=Pseudomonas sp. Gutcm_11s TaxID=3026088 RepID=UPI00235F3E35|nr:Fic family protein [Pseudomonas sp. Gutcm_11s]MDD0841412.1 Fic family protein [Pseudomonas sp. Gutcm_11s]
MIITSKHFLDPVLPEPLPGSITAAADQISEQSQLISSRLAAVTAKKLSDLLRITNAYHSNLIEGYLADVHHLQKAQLNPPPHTDLVVRHMRAQQTLEQAVSSFPGNTFGEIFAPELISQVHHELFDGEPAMVDPGRLRAGASEQVQIGRHIAPPASLVLPMLQHLQHHFGRIQDPRRQVVAVLANHHRLALIHPFLDGNGRTTRMLTHLQLAYLGLKPEVWSLCRGLAYQRTDYYRHLALADRPREGDYDGRGQLSRRHFFDFIEFLLDVSAAQIQYILEAIPPLQLHQRVMATLAQPQQHSSGMKLSSAQAITVLFEQGSMPLDAFKLLLGLGDRADEEVHRLSELGLINCLTGAPVVEIALPIYFAEMIFPQLHVHTI